MTQRVEILTAALLMLAVVFCPFSAAPQTQTNPPEQKAAALSWPAPDAWEFVESWKAPVKVLHATSAYVQSTLAPEESGVPTWFKNRYQPALANKAELLVFIRHGKFTWNVKELMVAAYTGWICQALVTDADGTPLWLFHGNSSAELWERMKLGLARAEEDEERTKRKADKERQKTERKKKP